ncbi:unnamed protein product [Urochloa humidicola]
MASTPPADASASPYDRQAELRALDATKAGVRGLVASGATTVPRIFHMPDPKTIHAAVKTVWYNTNFDFYKSPVASWRDSLYITMEPNPPALGELPDNCRQHPMRSVKNFFHIF